ncbi:carboxypeptidase-like regulatory domain-containing protein [Parapedobacter sp.]
MINRWKIATVRWLAIGMAAGVLATGNAAAQQGISGSLKTTHGRPIAHASVILRYPQGRVIAFNVSDAAGRFHLTLPANRPDSLRLAINHLGYAPVDFPVTPGKERYDLVLDEKAIDLSEVSIKSRPRIDVRGDTLAYDVGSFAKPEDRSIGDVLRRMPGMEVSESGQIKFNGQNISNFYIDGDDLLDDKYGIGTKTIPHAMVKNLEVLQNHQPLKVLKNKTLTDRVALNLVIKDEAKLDLSGQAKMGIGLPHQYDGELNAILFNKKYKMLNVLKGNNVGDDLSADFTAFGLTDRLANADNSRPDALLSAGTADNPPLPRQRYYLNQSGSLNTNNLVNLKNGLQLKSNVHGLLDHHTMTYGSFSEFYLGNDTIRYTERQSLGETPFLTEASFTTMVNEASRYFNNVLTFAYSGQPGSSELMGNDQAIDQQLHHRIRDFSNTLRYTPALKNGDVINANWYINHYNQPQTLSLNPGISADVLNNGRPFAGIRQFAETPTWFSRLSVDYGITRGFIKQRYRMGTVHEWQQLHSALRLMQVDGSETPYRDSDDNDLHWQRHRFFVDGTYEYKRRRIEVSLLLPLAIQRTAYRDDTFALDTNVRLLLFNPSLRAKLMTTTEDYLSFTYRYGNHLGNINGVFRGAVLANYRNIHANDAPLQEHDNHTLNLQYHYQRAIHLLFANAGISYTRSMANTIAASALTDHIARTILLPFDNDVSSLSAQGGISKFIFALGATASLKASWRISRFNQLLNGAPLPFHNQSITLEPGLEARLWERASITYNGSGTWTTSLPIGQGPKKQLASRRQIERFDQSVSITYSPFNNTFLRLTGRHQFSSQQGQAPIVYFFTDADIRYTLPKWHADLAINLTNLTHVTVYETYALSANHFAATQYTLRGRMAVLKATFNL